MTLGCGTRGFVVATRSIQTQTNPFSLPLLRTENAKRSGASSAAGSESAMRRTSAWVAMSIASGEGVEEVHVRLHRAVEPRDLRIGRLDDVILVRGVGAAPMAEPEDAGRQLERLAGERHPWPRAGPPRPEEGLHTPPALRRD